MEQRFDGTLPSAVIRLEGRRVTRGDVANDWGLKLQWVVRRNGEVVATENARAEPAFEHAESIPGTYEIVLQMWKYINYAKDASGEFVNSRFVDVSNKVSYVI